MECGPLRPRARWGHGDAVQIHRCVAPLHWSMLPQGDIPMAVKKGLHPCQGKGSPKVDGSLRDAYAFASPR